LNRPGLSGCPECIRIRIAGTTLTEGICAQQLEELASLLDSKHCDLVHLY